MSGFNLNPTVLVENGRLCYRFTPQQLEEYRHQIDVDFQKEHFSQHHPLSGSEMWDACHLAIKPKRIPK